MKTPGKRSKLSMESSSFQYPIGRKTWKVDVCFMLDQFQNLVLFKYTVPTMILILTPIDIKRTLVDFRMPRM